MRNAAQAYQATAKQTSSPRALEADLLLKAASRLKAIQDGWDKSLPDKSQPGLSNALLYNRKLWTIFLSSATSNDNPLPTAVRQNVANLGVFIMNETLACLADPRPDRLSTLITINRELAAGLRGSA